MQKTIMTVDDSKSVRQLVSSTLSNEGYRVIEAAGGKDALNKLSRQISLILADIHMPDMDGVELIRTIREMPDYRFLPIIALTTETRGERKMEGKSAGATGWIIKPFEPAQLLAVVKKVLG